MMHGGRNDGEASLVAGLLAVMATTDTDKASEATSAAATPRPVVRVLDPAEYTTKQDGIYRTFTFDVCAEPANGAVPTASWAKKVDKVVRSYFSRKTKFYTRRWLALLRVPAQLALMLRFINETNEGRRGTLVLLMLANALQKLLPVWRSYKSDVLLKMASEARPGSAIPWEAIGSNVVQLLIRGIDKAAKCPRQNRAADDPPPPRAPGRHGARERSDPEGNRRRRRSSPARNGLRRGWSERPDRLLLALQLLARARRPVGRRLHRTNVGRVIFDLALEQLKRRWLQRRATRRGPGIFHEITSNSFKKLNNHFTLGTAPDLPREVRSVNAQSELLAQFAAVKKQLDLEDDVSEELELPPNYYEQEMASIMGTASNPLSNAAYIVMVSLQSPTSALLSLAQATQLTMDVSRISWDWQMLAAQLTTLTRRFSSVKAYYDIEAICTKAQNESSTPYVSVATADSPSQGMRIEFKNVSMRYPGAQRNALTNVSFKIEPGRLCAVVGHNGSGKTTLISLLAMSEHLTEGKILINGVSIADYAPSELLQHIRVSHQTSPSLPFTVKDYLSFGAGEFGQDHDPDRLKHALDFAGATEVVADLEQGWNSYLGGIAGARLDAPPDRRLAARPHGGPRWLFPRVIETIEAPPTVRTLSKLETHSRRALGRLAQYDLAFGDEDATDHEIREQEKRGAMSIMEKLDVRQKSATTGVTFAYDSAGNMVLVKHPKHSPAQHVLSGGQWQRITLSRIVMKPGVELILFDEPAAALDPGAEAALFGRILELRGTATILFTTHRFSTTSKADAIFVFSGGHLVEVGTHSELMDVPEGEYKRMWELQAAGFQDGTTDDRESVGLEDLDWLDLATSAC